LLGTLIFTFLRLLNFNDNEPLRKLIINSYENLNKNEPYIYGKVINNELKIFKLTNEERITIVNKAFKTNDSILVENININLLPKKLKDKCEGFLVALKLKGN
ncbi:MAG: hypothetical protein ACOCP8_03065, partial [archaeon]